MSDWMRIAAALALIAVLGACKKKEEAATTKAAETQDAAADEGPPPPPPPPEVGDHAAEIEGWSLAFGMPDGFVPAEGKVNEFRPADAGGAVTLGVVIEGAAPPFPASWRAEADRIMLRALAAYDFVDHDDRRTPAQVIENERLGAGRYRYEVKVPAGDALLGKETLAGGVILFDDAWPGYVTCYWTADFQGAPTFRPALIDACERLAVKAAPARPAPPPETTTDPVDDDSAEPPDRPAPERTPPPAEADAGEPPPAEPVATH
jgi:hypothetical protein